MQASPQVREAPPSAFLAPDGPDPTKEKGWDAFVASLLSEGQKIPVPCYPVDDLLKALDGRRRINACRELGRNVRYELVDPPQNEVERLVTVFTYNGQRRVMSAIEQRQVVADLMKAGGLNQSEVARRLSMSEGRVSRLLTLNRLSPEMVAQLEQAGASDAVWMLCAPVRSVENRWKAVDFATTKDENGKLPTRDQVAAFVKKLEEKRGAKPKLLKGKINGRIFTLGINRGESTESVVEALKELIRKLKGHDDLPPDSLGPLFV